MFDGGILKEDELEKQKPFLLNHLNDVLELCVDDRLGSETGPDANWT